MSPRGRSRPLRRLQRRASGLDPRSSPARLDHTPTRIAEVDDLAHTLRTVLARYDEQAARTAEALATARSFASAASHELRTPLMSMQTNLEILAGHPELAGADRDEVLHDLRREHARLLGLLVMLRDLGRGDLVEADAFGPVDLADVVEASTEEQRRRHPRARLSGHCVPGLWVHGWEPGLRTVVDNLLVNALVHGHGEGRPARVEVSLRASGTDVILVVDDQGPGIPPELRAQVFERFRQPARQSGLRPRAHPGRPADRPAPGPYPGPGPADGARHPYRGHAAARQRRCGRREHAAAPAQLDDRGRRPATRIPQGRLLVSPVCGQPPVNTEEFVMPSTRKTVVSLVAVGTLLGAAGVAAADTGSPAPSGAPTGDGAAALSPARAEDRQADRPDPRPAARGRVPARLRRPPRTARRQRQVGGTHGDRGISQ